MGKFRDWLSVEGPAIIFVALWLAANAIVFAVNFVKYAGNKWVYLRCIVGPGLQIARGAANILNLNAALILLPVCRNFVNWTRGCFESRRSIRRLLDRNILFHKYCGYMLCFGSALHIGAHLFNVKHIIDSEGQYYRVEADEGWEQVLFETLVGLTGIGITVSLILMVSTAVEQIRRSYFELFWYTHHLFIVFYGCMLFHGYTGFVGRQTNFDDVGFNCSARINNGVKIADGGPGSYMWLAGPLGLYLSERLYRLFMSITRPLRIVRVVKHKDSIPVMEINFTKIPTVAGQYVFINCPAVSQLEWHPFTLTSCPELETTNLHIRVCGDWTIAMAEACGFNCCTFELKNTMTKDQCFELLDGLWKDRHVKRKNLHMLARGRVQYSSADAFFKDDLDKLKAAPEIKPESVTDKTALDAHLLPKVAIDGPFGTASEDIYRFKTTILVGAGIGVTPFASLLQAFFFRVANPQLYPSFKTEKIYFFWLCPGFDAWSWFASLLIEVEAKLIEAGLPDFLHIRIHTTRGWTDDDAKHFMLMDDGSQNIIVRDEASGRALKAPMQFGRPHWSKVFHDVAMGSPNTDIGVFLCGPKVLSVELHENCRKMTADQVNGSRFFYHKENF